jgi:hypothetical protein
VTEVLRKVLRNFWSKTLLDLKILGSVPRKAGSKTLLKKYWCVKSSGKSVGILPLAKAPAGASKSIFSWFQVTQILRKIFRNFWSKTLLDFKILGSLPRKAGAKTLLKIKW